MHPHHRWMRFWWQRHGHCGFGEEERGGGGRHHGHHRGGPHGFGVRRPLRFLARHLDLDDKQVSALAGVISALKTERAQAEVDDRRAQARYADAIAADPFDAAAASDAGQLRKDAASRVQDAVSEALDKIHQILDPDQRAELATLIRTGGLRI